MPSNVQLSLERRANWLRELPELLRKVPHAVQDSLDVHRLAFDAKQDHVAPNRSKAKVWAKLRAQPKQVWICRYSLELAAQVLKRR